jgi:hypothetical protein
MRRPLQLASASQLFTRSHTKRSSLVLDIPADIFAELLTEWLQLGSVVNLDSAFCNTSERTDFLAAAYGGRLTFIISDAEPRYERSFSWCLTRNVKVDGIYVLSSQTYKPFLSIMGPYLRWAVVRVQNEDCRFAVLDIVQWCPNIHSLSIEPPASLDGGTITSWSECLLRVIQSCQHLQTLHLTDMPLSTSSLTRALDYCGKLSQLTIACPRGPGPSYRVTPSSLSHLDIRYCGRATDTLMLAIAKNCPTLQSLLVFYYSSITDIGVRAVLQGCPLLRETDVEYATGISRELRIELARRSNATELGFDDTSKWTDIDEGMLLDLLLVSPALTSLSIFDPPWATDTALALCAEHCAPLSELKFFKYHGITSTAVLPFLKRGLTLRSIHLIVDLKPADELVLAVAEHCPHLEALYLLQSEVSDAAVAVVAERCTRLQTLFLQDCFGVTMVGVRALAEHCSELRALTLPTSLDGQTLPHFHRLRAPVVVDGAKVLGNLTCLGSYTPPTRWEAFQQKWKWAMREGCSLCVLLLVIPAAVEWLELGISLDWRWNMGVCCLSLIGVAISLRFKKKSHTNG